MIRQLKTLAASMAVEVSIVEQVCLGRCEEGIAMRIAPGGPFFTRVSEADLVGIVTAIKDFTPPSRD